MAEHKHGEMDIKVQEHTFERFVRVSAWACVAIVVFLIFLAIVNS